MSWLSVLYIIILFAGLGVVGYVRWQLQFPARRHWFRRALYLVIAIAAAGLTWFTSQTLVDLISGGFIAGMFGLFAAWSGGVTSTALVNGIGSMRPLATLTKVILQPAAYGTLIVAQVGEVVVLRLQMPQPPEMLAAFLREQMPPERVVVAAE